MKIITIAALFTLTPSAALGAACNADNVLRALRGHSAQASPFCSTYTRPPPNQPLPTYVSTYPASRVSSACSCLITSTSSSSSTSTSPTPTPYYCETDAITNGDFNLLANGKPDPWIFNAGSSYGNGYSYLNIASGQSSGFSGTSIKQYLPGLCYGVTFNLTYTSQMTIIGGEPGRACSASYSLASVGQLVYIGPPSGDYPPFSTETRSHVFTYYGNGGPDTLTISFSCSAPAGTYTIDAVHLYGYNHE
ncbi:MAG: hypothetical protein HETSPECPRED_000337 [Heterodermia speciosa]|uniref:Uncharacterized protein n=1 Tax=Heterodermia speciosa TaxID=116794 RepID=A0A8H3I8K3_9LECA|nr:MAG: hypothetical protein HETSPECPRED_000337 [Heterodermia speciosa]